MSLPETSFHAPSGLERVFNRIYGSLVGLGLGFSYNYLLEVRGRKSGRTYSTPIDLLELNGKRYLVAPRGRTQWVRNAEAAGEVMLKKGRTRQRFRLRALADSEKPEVLKAYLDTLAWRKAAAGTKLRCRNGVWAIRWHEFLRWNHEPPRGIRLPSPPIRIPD